MVNSDLYTTSEANKKLKDGNWEKVEGEILPFKVGDKIYNKNTPNNVHTIIKIDKETDFFQIETTDGRKLQGSLKDTIEDVKSGELIVVKDFAFEVGHNIPESKGGRTTIDNLIPICGECNRSMGDRFTIDEFSRQFAAVVPVPAVPAVPATAAPAPTLFQRIFRCFYKEKQQKQSKRNLHLERKRSYVRTIYK
jgi:hypothetical protein